MLTFSLNNNFLLLSQDTSIRLTWHNPACFFESIPGDTGLGIDIPVNDHNRTYLGNPHRFTQRIAASTRELKNFEIRYSGKLLLKGSLIIQTANDEVYSGWLRSDVGNLGKAHREKYIYDIAAFNQQMSFVNKANYNPLVDPYGCPTIYNPEFFYDKGRKLTLTRLVENPEYVNLTWFQDIFKDQQPAYLEEPYETEALTEAFRTTGFWQVNKQNPDHTIETQTGSADAAKIQTDLPVNVVSPMLFLNYILKALFKDANFFIDKNFIADDPDLSKLILYSNFDISNLVFDVSTMQSFYGYNSYLQMLMSFAKLVTVIVRDYSGTFKYKDLLPKIKLADFILSIQNLLNVFFLFRMDNKVDIVDRESLFTEPYIDIQQFMIKEWSKDEQKDSTLKFTFDHDMDDTVFSEHWTDLEDLRADIIGTRETWDDLVYFIDLKVGDIIYLTTENVYVKYSWIQKIDVDINNGQEIQTDTLGWEKIAEGFQNGFYKYGREEEETIETKFGTLMGDNATSLQRGNVNAMKYAYQNFSPRLLFYHGDNLASYKTANLMLDWEKEDIGLLKKRYPKWNRFWANRLPVSSEADLPLNMLMHIVKNIYKRHRTLEGEFFIEKLETNFNLNSIGTTKISAFKI